MIKILQNKIMIGVLVAILGLLTTAVTLYIKDYNYREAQREGDRRMSQATPSKEPEKVYKKVDLANNPFKDYSEPEHSTIMRYLQVSMIEHYSKKPEKKKEYIATIKSAVEKSRVAGIEVTEEDFKNPELIEWMRAVQESGRKKSGELTATDFKALGEYQQKCLENKNKFKGR